MAIRREKVQLILEDAGFTTGMAKAAGMTAVLNKELDGLSGQAVRTRRATSDIDRDVTGLGRSADRTGNQIDRLSGRMRIFADIAATAGPSLIPMGAVGIQGLSGLTSQLGFSIIAAGTAVLAFQGIGDALEALNDAALEPTTANLEKAAEAMEQLSPAARDFVRQLQGLRPALAELRMAAANGMLPGLSRGLDGLMVALPRVEGVLSAIAAEMGAIAGDAGESLGGPRWAEFIDFIGTEGPSALRDLSTALGNTTHALAELWMATTPMNRDFADWLIDVTARFDRWAADLSGSQGFADFLDYLHQTGPQVGETLGAIGNMLLQLTQAASALGGPSLKVIEAVADAIAAIADSDLGTPILAGVAALAAYNRMLQITAALQARMSAQGGPLGAFGARPRAAAGALRDDVRALSDSVVVFGSNAERTAAATARMRSRFAGLARTGAMVGGLAIATSDLAQSTGLANTASGAMWGGMTGPWGAAIGATAGLTLDLAKANNGLEDAIKRVNAAARAGDIDKLREELAGLDAQIETMASGHSVADALTRMTSGDKLNKIGNALKFTPIVGGFLSDWTNSQEWGTSALEKTEAEKRQNEAKLRELEINDRAVAQQRLLASGLNATKYGYDAATLSTEQFAAMQAKSVERMIDSRKAARDVGKEFTAFGDSLDDSKVSLTDWIREMEEQAAALRDFTKNSREAGRKGLRDGLIKELQAAGPEGAMRMKQLANATDAEIKRANRAWREGRAAIREYVDLAGGVPPTTLDVNNLPALNGIDEVANALRRLHDRTVRINVQRFTNEGKGGAGKAGEQKAAGGRIVGPGGPTDDLIPAWLSNGEYVISAAAVARYGAGFFDALNAQRLAAGGQPGKGKGTLFVRDDLGMTLDTLGPRKALKQLEKALERSKAAVDKERSARDDLVSRQSQLSSSVTDKLTQGLFDRAPSDMTWLSAADRTTAIQSSVFAALDQTRADSAAWKSAEQMLAAKGVKGDAFSALVEQARNPIELQAIAAMSQADISRYINSYATSTALATSAGVTAGDLRYGAELKAQNAILSASEAHQAATAKDVKVLTKEVKQLKNAIASGAQHVASGGKKSKQSSAAAVKTKRK